MFSDLMRLSFLLLLVLLVPVSLAGTFEAEILPNQVMNGSEYNFTAKFNNTDISNATKINLTLPLSLVYVEGSNQSLSDTNFTFSSNILSWEGNFTNDTIEELGFNATANSNENMTYNITMYVYYGSDVFSHNLSVTINSTQNTITQSDLNESILNFTPTSAISGDNYTFILRVNNSNNLNITKIELNLTDFMTYIEGSGFSDNEIKFSRNSNQLIWESDFRKNIEYNLSFNATVQSDVNKTESVFINLIYDNNTDLTQNTSIDVESINYTNSISDDSIDLVYPSNGTILPVGKTELNCRVNDTVELKRASLYFGVNSLSLIKTQNATEGSTFVEVSQNISLGDGTYNWNCESVDINDHSKFFLNDFTFFVDGKGPEITFSDPTPKHNASVNDSYFIVNATSNENISSANITIDFIANGNTTNIVNDVISVNGKSSKYIFNESNISDGYYEYTLTFLDEFNNSKTYSRGLFIDRQKPIVSLGRIPNIINGSNFSVMCSVYDNINNNLDFTYSIYQMNYTNKTILYNGTYNGSSYKINITSSMTQELGTYYLQCSVQDGAGNNNSVTKSYIVYQNTGSGYNNTQGTDNTNKNEISWETDVVNINDSFVFNVTDDRFSISKISVNTNSFISNVKLKFIRLQSLGGISTAPGIVYKYIKIEHGNLQDSNINNSTIEFEVNKNWMIGNNIDSSTIGLYRYSSGGWNKLKTDAIESGPTSIKFISESPGLSVFAISGNRKIADTTNNDSTQNEKDSTDADNKQSDTTDVVENEESGSILIALLFLIIIGSLIGSGIWYLNKKGVFVVMSIPDKNKN